MGSYVGNYQYGRPIKWQKSWRHCVTWIQILKLLTDTHIWIYSHPKISFALSFSLHLSLIALKGNVKQKVKEMRLMYIFHVLRKVLHILSIYIFVVQPIRIF